MLVKHTDALLCLALNEICEQMDVLPRWQKGGKRQSSGAAMDGIDGRERKKREQGLRSLNCQGCGPVLVEGSLKA